MRSFLILFFFFISCVISKRLYTQQFPEGSEQLTMPPTVAFSIFMGKIKYPHLPLLLESMRWNPMIHFKVINIIPPGSDFANDVIELQKRMAVQNFEVVPVTTIEFSNRVKEKLGIRVEYTMAWYYKMCDYKPIIAYLFPEHSGPQYKYWGFVDMDVIWGNFSRFAGWFQGQDFVISGWWRSTGAAQFFINEEWTRKLMFRDNLYVQLLANKTYHNLDEEGGQVDPQQVVDGGRHAISHYILGIAREKNIQLNRGKDWQDHCFLDEGDSMTWAGVIRWFRGSLQILHGSSVFPPGRELLFYHRATKDMNFPPKIVPIIFEDMMKYGFLLPGWIPLLTRVMCVNTMHPTNSTKLSMIHYQPFARDCVSEFAAKY